jgi:hypothetical protein
MIGSLLKKKLKPVPSPVHGKISAFSVNGLLCHRDVACCAIGHTQLKE